MTVALGLLMLIPSLLVLSLVFRHEGFRHYLKGVAVLLAASLIALLVGLTLARVWQ